jgi:hypothetical protein
VWRNEDTFICIANCKVDPIGNNKKKTFKLKPPLVLVCCGTYLGARPARGAKTDAD